MLELEPLSARLREAEAALKSLYSDVDKFTLKEGESRSLLGYEIGLAVHSVFSSGVNIVFDNRSATLHPGEEVSATKKGKTCRLRLESVTAYPNNTADFTVIIEK